MSCTIRRFLYKYRQLKCTNPMLVNSAQIGLLMGLGDVISQKFFEEECEIDWLRAVKAASLGAFFVGPAASAWFRYMDKKFACKPCKECSKVVLAFKKILATELLFAPLITATGLAVMSTIDGKCAAGIVQNVNEKFGDIMLNSWTFWPIVHFVRYLFLIPRHQMFLYKGAFLLWSVYLAYKYHLDECAGCCDECEDDDD